MNQPGITISKTAPIERGDRFGALVVVRPSLGKHEHGKRYRVHCDCGRRTFVKGSKLRNGQARDCGRCAAPSSSSLPDADRWADAIESADNVILRWGDSQQMRQVPPELVERIVAALRAPVSEQQPSLADLEEQLKKAEFEKQAFTDALRYRWLKSQTNSRGKLTIARVTEWELEPWSGDDMESKIDAAMSAERHGDGG